MTPVKSCNEHPTASSVYECLKQTFSKCMSCSREKNEQRLEETPGVGKTHLVSALALQALEAGYSVLFTTLTHLVEDLTSVPHPSLWRQRLRRYQSPRVLVIDEVGYTKLTAEQAHHLFELVTERYEKGAILLSSNTSFAEWGTLLNDEVLATALLDRLLHHAEVLNILDKNTHPLHFLKPL